METTIKPEMIMVRSQDTPNPKALRFIVNYPLKETGNATFSEVGQAEGFILIESLFNIVGVRQVYLFENTMTVTHEGLLDNEVVKEHVESIIKTRLPIHNPEFIGPNETPVQREKRDRSNMDPELVAIEEILDRTIRPGLQADGGDLEIMSFENNELRVLYMGACGGCPSAMMGTLDAIQNILRHELGNHDLFVIPI